MTNNTCQRAWNSFSVKENFKKIRNTEQQRSSGAHEMSLFGPRWHNSSMVASTKPTAYNVDWALILGAIIYLSHIGCQMDACPEKSLLTTKLKRSNSESSAAEKAWEEEEVSTEDTGAIGSTAETKKREGQERDKMATYERLQQRAFLQVL